MSIFVWANNASSLLASSMTNSQTTATVTTGQGALFPAISAGQVAACTIEDVSGNIEVVYATGRTGDTFTIIRAQEGTTALPFASGSRFEQRPTAGEMEDFLQKTGGDTLSGTTNLTGVLSLGSGGSIQNGEIAGAALRSAPGVTSNQILIPIGGGPATQAGSVLLTASNIQTNLGAGQSLILSGMVLGWAGTTSNVPSGFHLCDGTDGTINLTDQFIVGATENSVLPPGPTNLSATTQPASAGTPTINPVTLAATNLPTHQHPFDYAFGNSTAVIGIPSFALPGNYIQGGSGTGTRVSFAGAVQSGTTGQAFTPTAAALGTHTHSITSPPYTALLMIQKL